MPAKNETVSDAQQNDAPNASPNRRAEGEAPSARVEAESNTSTKPSRADGVQMEAILTRENLLQALKRVVSNQGSAGVDGVEVGEIKAYLNQHWAGIKTKLLDGTYQPQPVRRVAIPKADGGERLLGIPVVIDRLIQQALLQVLQAQWDDGFSPYSYGFRPGKSAHLALLQAKTYVDQGRGIVVDVDIEKFFDRVNHDILMTRVMKRVSDPRIRKLIRRYLEAGVMEDGVVSTRTEGTPQGGPLSPLLANLLLDEVDRELERRGHCFVRYADDCNIYVKSERAGQRVMAQITALLARLKLKVNTAKSAVAFVEERQFLGYRLQRGALDPSTGTRGATELVIAPRSQQRLREAIRRRTRRTVGKKLRDVIAELSVYLRGWAGYFRLAEQPWFWQRTAGWVGRRLRALLLKQWGNAHRAYTESKKLGASEHMARAVAHHQRRAWFTAGSAMNAVVSRRQLHAWGLYDLAQHAR